MSSDCIAWSARFATLAPACTQHEKTIRKPCAGNPHARFERGTQEPGPERAPRLRSTNEATEAEAEGAGQEDQGGEGSEGGDHQGEDTRALGAVKSEAGTARLH